MGQGCREPNDHLKKQGQGVGVNDSVLWAFIVGVDLNFCSYSDVYSSMVLKDPMCSFVLLFPFDFT